MADLISVREVKTRTPHKCQACGQIIPAGTTVQRTVSAEDGQIGSFYWCHYCVRYMARLDPLDLEGGFNYDIWEYDDYREFREQLDAQM